MSEKLIVSLNGMIRLCFWILIFVFPIFAEKPIGMNLATMANYNGQIVFADISKQMGEWVTGYASGENTYNLGWNTGGRVPLGTNGYPLEIPYSGVSVSTPTILQRNIFYGIGGKYPGGTYTLVYEGTGRLLLTGDAVWQKFASSGTFQVNITPGPNGLHLVILESKASDPVRNIRLILPGYAATYQSNPFYSTFLDRLRGFKAIRFLDWSFIMWDSSATTVSSWNDRITTDYYTQTTSSGVAHEHLIQLCNEVDADAWLCIPHMADDNYVTQCARLWRDNLEAGRKLYIEYSNETWNDSYSSEVYCRTQGLLQNLDADALTARDKFYVKRALEIFKIFETEFGGSSRLQKIISSQAANTWVATRRMSAYANPAINISSMTADILAFDGYFAKLPQSIGDRGEINTIMVEEILNRSEVSIISSVYTTSILEKISNHKTLARTYGLRMCAYEGGQYLAAHDTQYLENTTLTDKLTVANREERMYDLYIKLFSAWFQNGGDLFMNFLLCELPSKYGNMGNLEWTDQPVSSAPKYRAVSYVLNSTATAPSNFTGIVVSTTAINWSWTAVQDAKYYYIYSATSTDVNDFLVRLSTQNISWLQQDLSPGTTSELRIGQYNIFADTSPLSGISSAVTTRNPVQGENPPVTPPVVSSSTYTATKSIDISGGAVSVSPPTGEMTVTVPAGCFDSAINLTVRASTSALPAPDETKNPLMQATTVAVKILTDAPANIKKEIEIILTYRDQDVSGMDENKLIIARYNSSGGNWLPLLSYPYPEQNKVRAYTDHLSLFRIMHLGSPVSGVKGIVFPNPFYPYKGHRNVTFYGFSPGQELKIHTLNLELVKELYFNPAGMMTWDGKNSEGKTVSSGVYIYRTKNPSGKSETGKMVIFK